MALQPDGKVVVVGTAATGSSSADYAIARIGVDGTLDNSFSGDGKLLVSFTAADGPADAASAVAIDRFGRIVVAGITGSGNVGVVRLLSNGSLDPSFGVNGKTSPGWSVTTPLRRTEQLAAHRPQVPPAGNTVGRRGSRGLAARELLQAAERAATPSARRASAR